MVTIRIRSRVNGLLVNLISNVWIDDNNDKSALICVFYEDEYLQNKTKDQESERILIAYFQMIFDWD